MSTSPPRIIEPGEVLYAAGEAGNAWLLREGSIRLDRPGMKQEESFVGLAVKGDVLGAETLLLGAYTFTATALTPCVLELWADNLRQPEPSALLQAITAVERRGAETVALRCGEAVTRVRRLIGVLAAGQPLSRLMLPQLRDMAQMTALTISTVSRILGQMQVEGAIEGIGRTRGRPKKG